MKTGIHPQYLDSVEIRCSCGNIIMVGSTKEKMKTELCSKCHPFYTGTQKLVDTAGRVDKFQAKRKKALELHEEAKRHAEAKKKKPEAYKEKIIPVEVLEKSSGVSAEQTEAKGKWGAPLGDSPAQEMIKEDKMMMEKKPVSKAKTAVKKAVVKKITKKAVARKPAKKATKKKS